MKIQIQNTDRNRFIEEFHMFATGKNLKHYASDVAREAEFVSDEELENAVKKSMQVCRAMQIPIKEHFRLLVKSTPYGSEYDWKISDLGYALIYLNGNGDNPHVAEMQLHLLKKMK